MELKIGDRVKGVDDYKHSGHNDYIGTIVCMHGSAAFVKRDDNKDGTRCDTCQHKFNNWEIHKKDGGGWGSCIEHGKLIIISGGNMQKLNSMLKRLLDSNTQKLYKAGMINGDLELTETGKDILWGIIFTQYKTELLKEAIDIIKEEEKKK